jgi:hypothetical protein
LPPALARLIKQGVEKLTGNYRKSGGSMEGIFPDEGAGRDRSPN